MSLHLGHLSPYIRRDELEHVFRQFGQCNIRIKDKFGFVVYDFPANAAKALRTLRGRKICGQPITITWSNKQPRPLQRFERGSRIYEPQHGRYSGRGHHIHRKLVSNGRRSSRMGFSQQEGDVGRLNSSDLVDQVASYHYGSGTGNVVENHHSFQEDIPDEGGDMESNPLENDRWGEQVGDPLTETGLDFDRYEPHNDDDRRNDDEKMELTHSDGSPSFRRSEEKRVNENIGEPALNHHNHSKQLLKCYTCGESGHKMRNCPHENHFQKNKFHNFDKRQDDGINIIARGGHALKRPGTVSKKRMQSSREDVSWKRHKFGRNISRSRKYSDLTRTENSPVAEEIHKQWRREVKKQTRRDDKSPERRLTKNVNVSSPYHSEYTASRSPSHSKSSRSVSASGLHLKLRSTSSRTDSQSSSSISGSRHISRAGSSKTMSSPPLSLSLSVSLGRPLPSCPKKVQIDQKNSLTTAARCKFNGLVSDEHFVEVDVESNNYQVENTTLAERNQNAVATSKGEEDMNKDCAQKCDDDLNLNMSRVLDEVKESCYLPPVEGDLDRGGCLEDEEKHNCDDLMTGHMLVRAIESRTPLRSHVANSMNISSEEICIVMKHYCLRLPEENEKDLPTEALFGSARLWPWEIIYYRRLRKGPISTENYARRLAQNEEFGIVDKFVRRSSGWGELDLLNA